MRRFVLAATALLTAAPAYAQSNSELMDRISRLERDVNFVQKQVYTGAAAGDPNAMPATGADSPDSNAAYTAAFKELNAKNYSGAASKFDDFVRKYPKDPLTSNAYYWLGESYYARGDYTRAAEGFRKGFESNPQGQKAPDNLLKLAMSLDNIKRTSEACIVLGQIVSKYGDSAPRTKERADAERSRMQCK